MKFLAFADFHHTPGILPGCDLDDLHLIQRRAEEEQCDFMIHAGDFCNGPMDLSDYINEYNDFHIPSYHCLGNHDADQLYHKDVLALYRMEKGYYFFDCKGYRMVILDPNYLYLDGKYINYENGNYYPHPEARDHVPPEQLKWLEETIASSPYPCIIVSHESFGRDEDPIKNYLEIRKVLNDANKRKKHSVIMCICGHYHCNHMRILDGICYLELPSSAFYALANRHSFYPKEETKDIEFMDATIVFDDPLYAIITVEGTTITIEGNETTLHNGVTLAMVKDYPYDDNGRICEPKIHSEKITLL